MLNQENATTTVQPRTANLLACRQWWKVCFLYGDQEKYYRQIYGKAASQRMALSVKNEQRMIYPMKGLKPVMLNDSPIRLFEKKRRNRSEISNRETIDPHSRVTVLDDPFLFGFDDYGSDSGIDANPSKPPKILPLEQTEPKPILKTKNYQGKAHDIADSLKHNILDYRIASKSNEFFDSNNITKSFVNNHSNDLCNSELSTDNR